MLEIERKLKGAFFTAIDIATYLTRRVVTSDTQKVLEPSFGDGSFIMAVMNLYEQQGWNCDLKDNLFSVEIRKSAVTAIQELNCLDSTKIIFDDFLAVEPFPVDVVVGNPPYVGLNKLSTEERNRALYELQRNGFSMQSNGSLWLPFFTHAIRFLKNDGVIAFVLPFEVTYVKYSQQLWKYLGRHFSEITVVRVFEDMFPEVDVETVLFIAKGFGGSCNYIKYEIYDNLQNLFNGNIDRSVFISINSILTDQRPFVSNLLGDAYSNILAKLQETGYLRPITEFCKFKIGYVSADQDYFHPTDETIDRFGIDQQDLIPSIPNAKTLKQNVGLDVGPNVIKTKLFYPRTLNSAQNYIDHGELLNVNNRYKCKQRKPWFITPGVEIPDVFLTVFGDTPRFFMNSGKYSASNSLLIGFLKNSSLPKEILALSWYNSITLLSIELTVHSLGGGVLVLIPGETDRLSIINPVKISSVDDSFLIEIDHLLRNNATEEAYQLGDVYLCRSSGITFKQIESIRKAIHELRRWRNSRLRKQR